MRRARWTAADALVLGLLTSLGAGASPAERHGAAHTYTVTIEGVQFHPETLTVHSGDRIVWTNKDPFPHTVTADATAAATTTTKSRGASGARAFDSNSLAPDASWTYVARRRGEYSYACTLHPTMKGKIIVQ